MMIVVHDVHLPPSLRRFVSKYIRENPKEGKGPIKTGQIERIEKDVRSGGTESIQLKDVKLQVDAPGTEIAALQPGGGDLSPLSTLISLKAHIADSIMILSPNASLLRIPPFALLKLVRLRLWTANLLCFETFGHLVWKDPVLSRLESRNTRIHLVT